MTIIRSHLQAGLISPEEMEYIRSEFQKVFGDKERCAKFVKDSRALYEKLGRRAQERFKSKNKP